MDAEVIEIAKAFNTVTFLPGSYDKRFCHDMAAMAHFKPESDLTDKQVNLIYTHLHRYRNQLQGLHQKYCKKCK